MTQNDLRKKYPYYDQIQRFRLIDDTFMSVVFQDIGCTQFLIRILLQNDGLNVTEVGTQNSLKNLRGRSVRLDIIAYDKQGKIYNIEVQRKDAGALPKRARSAFTMKGISARRFCASNSAAPRSMPPPTAHGWRIRSRISWQDAMIF